MKYSNWQPINWTDVSEKVINLQGKIFQASKVGNLHRVHLYQTTRINMYEVYKWLIHGHCHDDLPRDFKGSSFPYLKGPIKREYYIRGAV